VAPPRAGMPPCDCADNPIGIMTKELTRRRTRPMLITCATAAQQPLTLLLIYRCRYGQAGFSSPVFSPSIARLPAFKAVLPVAPTTSPRFPVSGGCAITFEPCNLQRSRRHLRWFPGLIIRSVPRMIRARRSRRMNTLRTIAPFARGGWSRAVAS
jgi:hypothetical protein